MHPCEVMRDYMQSTEFAETPRLGLDRIDVHRSDAMGLLTLAYRQTP
jgi:hypothetical protein